MNLLPFLLVLALADPPAPTVILPDVAPIPVPQPQPKPDPTLPTTLSSGQRYIVRSANPIAIRCTPKGLIEVCPAKKGPQSMSGFLIAGPTTPGGTDGTDGTKDVDRTFTEANIYVLKPTGTGLCNLLIVLDLADPSKDIERQINANVAPIPPPIPPTPPTPPEPPDPFEGAAPAFRVLIVYDDATRHKLPTPQQEMLESEVWRKYAESKGTWRCFDKGTVLTNAPAPFVKAMAKADTSKLPFLLVGNGRTGYSGAMPGTIEDLMKLLRKYGDP